MRAQPRRLLQAIPGVTVREIAESEICCGSAGIYNLLEPDAATELRDRKVQNILKTDAEVIVSGNPGACFKSPPASRPRDGRCASCTSSKFSISRSVRVSEHRT